VNLARLDCGVNTPRVGATLGDGSMPTEMVDWSVLQPDR